MDHSDLKQLISSLLNQDITHFELKGQGMCNNAYYLETTAGNKYLVKQERPDKEAEEQNNLVVEGNIIQKLYQCDPSLPVPQVALVSQSPRLYGYPYLEGDMMINGWQNLDEQQRVELFESIGRFHALAGQYIDEQTARDVGLIVDTDLDNTTPDSYNNFLDDPTLPDEWKKLAQHALATYHQSHDQAIFQFIHNDAHNKNILLDPAGKLLSFVDFGDAEFGDVHKDFYCYVRDYPTYVTHAVTAYTKHSGNSLSQERIVAYAILEDLKKVAWAFHNPEAEQVQLQKYPGLAARERIEEYKKLLA